jgi:filamentous hemagglutinin family protein
MKLSSALVFAGASVVLLSCLPATAQIIPDNTLGNEHSIVVPNVDIDGINSDLVEGGAIRDANLFHSFQEFNIDDGRGAYFASPEGIINILTRVTGNNLSNILGTLGVLGNANLFLINPNGIVFGPNARLDVSGSFFATTADSVLFDNFEFSASNPEAPPLLTINIPIGLNFRDHPGTIINQSGTVETVIDENGNQSNIRVGGLQVQPKQTLALVGGDIQLENSFLTAPQGRIELGSVAGNSTVSLNQVDQGYAFNYENVLNFQDIALSQQSLVDVRGEGGGDVQIQGKQVTLTNSAIQANTEGSEIGGFVSIQAAESLELMNSGIRANVTPNATGIGGNISINTPQLFVDSSSILTWTEGTGNAGNISINAANVELNNGGLVSADAVSEFTGNPGNITVNTQQLRVQDGAKIQIQNHSSGSTTGGNITVTATDIELIGTSAEGNFSSGLFANSGLTGQGGSITINTQNLLVQEGATIDARTFGIGEGGDINITASDIEVKSESLIVVVAMQGENTGNAGRLTINTQNLRVQDNARIYASTFGGGEGGDINIIASDIELTGEGSRIYADVAATEATGNGGSLIIDTQNLLVQDGATIDVATAGSGNAGNLTVIATDVELTGTGISDTGETSFSGLFAQVNPDAAGQGGNLIINTQNLSVQNGARIDAGTFGTGEGGNINITATNIELTGDESRIVASVEEGATGNGGGVTIESQNLSVLDEASIDASTSGTGEGGNINITAAEVLLQNRGNINTSSTVEEIAAGNIEINSPVILLNNNASIEANTSGGQGNILLNTSNLSLRRNSSISTNATGTAPGGNMTINTDFLIGLENSDITANAQQARGGQIIINANEGLFGIRAGLQATDSSDITATSELGVDFSGVVELNSSIDTSQSLTEFDSDVVDPSALIAQNPCQQGGESEFIITGRGGLPPNPTQEITPFNTQVNLSDSITETRSSSRSVQQSSRQKAQQPISSVTLSAVETLDIIPARGWIRNQQGDVILVDYDEVTAAPGACIPENCDPTTIALPRSRSSALTCNPNLNLEDNSYE